MVQWSVAVMCPSSKSIGSRECHDIAAQTITYPPLHSWHATVRMARFFGDSPHHNSPGCGKDSEGRLIREHYIFHIVHSPRFTLLAPLKSTFGIAMSDQGLAIAARPWISTLWSSRRTVFVEIGELRCKLNSAVSWAAVVLCFLDIIWVSTRTTPFRWLPLALSRQLLLLNVVHPSRWYADITLDTGAGLHQLEVKKLGVSPMLGFVMSSFTKNIYTCCTN